MPLQDLYPELLRIVYAYGTVLEQWMWTVGLPHVFHVCSFVGVELGQHILLWVDLFGNPENHPVLEWLVCTRNVPLMHLRPGSDLFVFWHQLFDVTRYDEAQRVMVSDHHRAKANPVSYRLGGMGRDNYDPTLTLNDIYYKAIRSDIHMGSAAYAMDLGPDYQTVLPSEWLTELPVADFMIQYVVEFSPHLTTLIRRLFPFSDRYTMAAIWRHKQATELLDHVVTSVPTKLTERLRLHHDWVQERPLSLDPDDMAREHTFVSTFVYTLCKILLDGGQVDVLRYALVHRYICAKDIIQFIMATRTTPPSDAKDGVHQSSRNLFGFLTCWEFLGDDVQRTLFPRLFMLFVHTDVLPIVVSFMECFGFTIMDWYHAMLRQGSWPTSDIQRLMADRGVHPTSECYFQCLDRNGYPIVDAIKYLAMADVPMSDAFWWAQFDKFERGLYAVSEQEIYDDKYFYRLFSWMSLPTDWSQRNQLREPSDFINRLDELLDVVFGTTDWNDVQNKWRFSHEHGWQLLSDETERTALSSITDAADSTGTMIPRRYSRFYAGLITQVVAADEDEDVSTTQSRKRKHV